MKKPLILLFTLLLALSGRAQVAPPDAVINGKTIPEWTADWWKWVYAQPTNASALFDTDGSQAANGQPGGGAFFVANIATPGMATRSFNVPEGSYLLFPVRYVTLDNVAFVVPLSVAQLRDAAAGVVDLMTNLDATIDGQAVDVSSHRVLSPVFSYDFPDANNLDSFLNGLDVTGLVDPIVSDGYWIMVKPLPIGTHVLSFGGDIGPPYNSSKEVTDYITVVPSNHAPIADTSATAGRAISPNNLDAKVVLNGSRSSDPDNDPLSYTWLESDAVIATGIVATNVLEAGSHTISLVVSDGNLSATNTITVDVVTPGQAVADLGSQLEAAQLARKKLKRLLEDLHEACDAFADGFEARHHERQEHIEHALRELLDFKQDVKEELHRSDPTLAESLIAGAQEIINAVGLPRHHAHEEQDDDDGHGGGKAE